MVTTNLSVNSKTADKLIHLKQIIKDLESAVIAFSGGVDSTLLSAVAAEILGDKALVIFARSPVVPEEESPIARQLASLLNFNYMEIEHNQLELPDFVCNGPDRCYHCKFDMLGLLKQLARDKGFKWVCEGSNFDDLNDFRPGLKAVSEQGVRSPLAESLLTKAEIRALAKQAGLDNWNKPASPCLASRVPYGTAITRQVIDKIGKSEVHLKKIGLNQVRLRHHGDVARIEVAGDDISKLLNEESRKEIVAAIKDIGYKYVTLDLQGFRSGSLNEVLQEKS